MQSKPQNQNSSQLPNENQPNLASGFTPDAFMQQHQTEGSLEHQNTDPAFDPNLNTNYNQFAQNNPPYLDPNTPANPDQFNQYSIPNPQPTNNLAQDPYYNDYSTYNPDPYAVIENSQNLDTLPAETATDSTPKETSKKRGNLIFYIVSGIIILFLLGVLGFFGLQLAGSGNSSSNFLGGLLGGNASKSVISSEISSSAAEVSSLAQSEINSTTNSTNASENSIVLPVVAAKKNNATSIPADWLKANFADSVDADGKCTVETKCGPGADPDNDGLNNLEEYNYGTNPNNPDSDSDGVSDGDEVKIFGTDPNKKDSDGDTFEDGSELVTCFDPAIKTNSKLSSKRKNDFQTKITSFKLHETTTASMKKAGATDLDLANGFIAKSCVSGSTVVQ